MVEKSAKSDIAEGYASGGQGQFGRFLNIAQGSYLLHRLIESPGKKWTLSELTYKHRPEGLFRVIGMPDGNLRDVFPTYR